MTKALIVALAALAYAGPQGARVAVTLQALHMGIAPAVVGILNALSFALPMLISIPAGRIVDRAGVRGPMLLCGAMMVCTLVLAWLGRLVVWLQWPVLPIPFSRIGVRSARVSATPLIG
jgi:MFS family permease